MKKKQQKTQLILISAGIILILLTYFYYPYINKDKSSKDLSVQKDLENITDEGKLNTFENVEYEGLYDFDKPFVVKSKDAYILDKDPNVVYMKSMHVILYLSDERIVNITSNKGRYNKASQDCFFEENVKATDGEVKIFAENLDLLATENFAKAYNKVKLNHPTGSLRADKVDYDFQTKYFKISMFGDKVVKMKVIR